MDATVNDFFKEINQISSTSSSKASSVTAAPLQEDGKPFISNTFGSFLSLTF